MRPLTCSGFTSGGTDGKNHSQAMKSSGLNQGVTWMAGILWAWTGQRRAPGVSFCVLLVALTNGLQAQTCLSLSPARVRPGATAVLDLSMQSLSGDHPAAVQWTFQYPPASVSNITVDDGPVLAAARKTVFCAGNAGVYRCVIAGVNPNEISDGVVARVTATLTANARTAAVLVHNPRATSASGYFIPAYAQDGTITVLYGFSRREPDSSTLAGGRGPCSGQTQEKDK